jgi:hypothetical protein
MSLLPKWQTEFCPSTIDNFHRISKVELLPSNFPAFFWRHLVRCISAIVSAICRHKFILVSMGNKQTSFSVELTVLYCNVNRLTRRTGFFDVTWMKLSKKHSFSSTNIIECLLFWKYKRWHDREMEFFSKMADRASWSQFAGCLFHYPSCRKFNVLHWNAVQITQEMTVVWQMYILGRLHNL